MSLLPDKTENLIGKARHLHKKKVKSITDLVKHQSKGQTEGTTLYYFWSDDVGWSEVGKGVLDDMKLDVDTKKIVDNAVPVIPLYRPAKSYLILDENGVNDAVMNTWKNPELEYKPLDKPAELPEVYKDFFYNFFTFDEDTERMFDWLSDGLNEKLQKFVYIVAIGGIGKGIMGEVISLLHLPENSGVLNNRDMGNRFDKLLNQKTFLYYDEPNVTNSTEQNKLKTFINKTMSLEEKNKNGITTEVFFNLLITGNVKNGIILEETEESLRRFWCPKPNEVSLSKRLSKNKKYKGLQDYLEQLLDKDNLRQFYWWLKERKTTTCWTDMIITNWHKELIGCSAPVWLQEAVEGYIEPQLERKEHVCFVDVKNWIHENCETIRWSIGRDKFKSELIRFYGNSYKMTMNNKLKGKEGVKITKNASFVEEIINAK